MVFVGQLIYNNEKDCNLSECKCSQCGQLTFIFVIMCYLEPIHQFVELGLFNFGFVISIITCLIPKLMPEGNNLGFSKVKRITDYIFS